MEHQGSNQGQSSQSYSQGNGQLRGLPENPAQALRRMPPTTIPQVPPIPANLRSGNPAPLQPAGAGQVIYPRDPSQGRSLPSPPSHDEVLQLARVALENALRDNATQAAGVTEIKAGVTIDLSRNGIRELPEEVVDIINYDLERLAISNNYLTTFPARFIECSSLRYLNIRNNQIREFPLTICNIKSLEILDLGRNKLRSIPQEIVKLSSLKVLAVQKNRIQELPLCLADMASLQVLKLEGNDLTFPPPSVMKQLLTPVLPGEGMRETDHEVALTTNIKKYLRQRALSGRVEIEVAGTGDDTSEGNETPRNHIRRAASGRFPIKVNGNEVSDMRSPGSRNGSTAGGMPLLSSRTQHQRMLSQQNTAIRRNPGIMPLTIGNPSERIRSNSETAHQRGIPERPESRNRRMAILPKKTELTPLDENQGGANNRFSHYRGLSHGSAMQPGGPGNKGSTPPSPGDSHMNRPIYVRRLSILPERRRESKYFDPIVEAAKGILYSIFQVHPTIQMLMGLTNDGTAKRSSLEILLYNTNSHVEELEQEIQKHDPTNHNEDSQYVAGENENVYRACQALIGAYIHVCALLMENVDSFVDNGDPRYIRTLLVMLYNSIMELRVTLNTVTPHLENNKKYSTMRVTNTVNTSNSSFNTGTSFSTVTSASTVATSVSNFHPSIDETIRPIQPSRTSSRMDGDANLMTPTAERPGAWPRRPPGPQHQLTALRVTTDMPYGNGSGNNTRNNTMGMSTATPRSGESFASAASGSRTAIDYSEEDKQFEMIFSALVNCTTLVSNLLPGLSQHFSLGLRSATQNRAPPDMLRCWKMGIDRSSTVMRQIDLLKQRMSSVKLKDPTVRTQPAFWGLCNNFFEAWSDLGAFLRSESSKLPPIMEHIPRLKPIHRSVKEAVERINRSPWGYMRNGSISSISSGPTIVSPPGMFGTHMHNPSNGSTISTGSAASPLPHPLYMNGNNGPGTPQSASFSAAFSGGFFERADALLSQKGGFPGKQGLLNHLAQSSVGSSNVSVGSMGDMSSQGRGMGPVNRAF